MARRRKKSMVFEVSQAITAINYIGQSKRIAKQDNKSGIHSIKQVAETLSSSQNFVKWIRLRFTIRTIFGLNEGHYRAYMSHLESSGRSAGHRQNVETALAHLQKGMNVLSKERQLPEVVFLPTKRLTDWRELKKPVNRSYSPQEYDLIFRLLSRSVQVSVKLMRYMGLRVRESCNIKVKHFIRTSNGCLELFINEFEAKGVTKGGRYRVTPVPKGFEKELLALLADKNPDDTLISITPATVRKGVYEACKSAAIVQDGRGTHGFRHLYCRERLKELLQPKGIASEGMQMLERIMANRDLNRKSDYGIFSEKDIRIYTTLKKCIDTIHGEIGHGKDRWDLAEIYLREGNR